MKCSAHSAFEPSCPECQTAKKAVTKPDGQRDGGESPDPSPNSPEPNQ